MHELALAISARRNQKAKYLYVRQRGSILAHVDNRYKRQGCPNCPLSHLFAMLRTTAAGLFADCRLDF